MKKQDKFKLLMKEGNALRKRQLAAIAAAESEYAASAASDHKHIAQEDTLARQGYHGRDMTAIALADAKDAYLKRMASSKGEANRSSISRERRRCVGRVQRWRGSGGTSCKKLGLKGSAREARVEGAL